MSAEKDNIEAVALQKAIAADAAEKASHGGGKTQEAKDEGDATEADDAGGSKAPGATDAGPDDDADKPKKGAEGDDSEDETHPKFFRKFRRKLREATAAQETLQRDLGPIAVALEAAKKGDAATFARALAAKGINPRQLAALLGGQVPPVARQAGEGGRAEAPQAKPQPAPLLDALERSVEEDTARGALESKLSGMLKGHPVTKLDGYMGELTRRLQESYDERTGRTASPKAVADAIKAEFDAKARALGYLPPDAKPKRGADVDEDDSAAAPPAPSKHVGAGKKPTLEEVAMARALAAHAREALAMKRRGR